MKSNGKVTKELKGFGLKVNGKEPNGEAISEVIKSIADDYEGGGTGGIEVIEIDFGGNYNKTLTEEEKETIINKDNIVFLIKRYGSTTEYDPTLFYKKGLAVDDGVDSYDIRGISKVHQNSIESSEWYGGLNSVLKSMLKINKTTNVLTIVNGDVDYQYPTIVKDNFDALYKLTADFTTYKSAQAFAEAVELLMPLWLFNQVRMMYCVETRDAGTEELTSRQYYEVLVNNDDITNDIVLYYFDNTGTRQTVNVLTLSETNYIWVGLHVQNGQVD